MPAIPVGFAHVLASIALAGDNELMAITFGIDVPTGGMSQTVANGVSQSVGTFLQPTMGNDYTFTGVDIAVGQDGGEPIHFVSTSGAVAGNQGASILPQNCALLFKKRTAVAGRKNRGRFYVPGCAESLANNTGVITTAGQTQLNTQAATLLTNLQTNDTPMVVLHTLLADPPHVVTSLTVDQRIATQRRRLR